MQATEAETSAPPTFETLPLSRETLGALSAMGYTHPTPVQRAVFDPASRGVDLVVQARTGTGKTAAFGLPIIDSVVRRQLPKVQVLILCPTRELAVQVTQELDRLGSARGVRPLAIYGGAPMERQVRGLKTGAQVVVGTPGRVLDHLQRGTLEAEDLRMVVLDEADEMLSMGFERELSAIFERLPSTRQTLLFSATIPPDIERIARDRLKTPEFITLSSDHVGALEISHHVFLVAGDKLDALLRVIELDNPESALVFCNTRAETERVAEALKRQGFAADWLNGDLPQSEREQVMSRTRQGQLRFLVATDVAARGIDITHLTHVINFDFPESAERYVHRTGRTGRAGRTGTAVSLITPKDIGALYLLRLTYKIRPIERQLPTPGELKTRAEADLVQLLIEAFASHPVHPDDLALARRLLSHDDAETVVAGLIRDHLGARPDAPEEAAAARRTRVATPSHTEPERAPVSPSTPPTGAELSKWSPPTEPGDDEPIFAELSGGASRERSPAARPRTGLRPNPRIAERPAKRVLPKSESGALVHTDDTTGFSWTEQPDNPSEAELENAPCAEVEAPATSHADDDPPFVEVFVNAGHRDGIGASDFQRALTDLVEADPKILGKVRVRDRNSFLSVKRDALERVLAILNGATLHGRTVQAEPARGRALRNTSSSGPSNPGAGGTSSPNEG